MFALSLPTGRPAQSPLRGQAYGQAIFALPRFVCMSLLRYPGFLIFPLFPLRVLRGYPDPLSRPSRLFSVYSVCSVVYPFRPLPSSL